MTVLEPFGARLRRAMDERGPLCVGIDPHASLLSEWGLNDDVAGLERFSRTVVEAVADRVAVLKPQSAFFERFGSRGVAVLEKSVEEARAAGALVVAAVPPLHRAVTASLVAVERPVARVIRSGGTEQDELVETLSSLRRLRVEVLGIVMADGAGSG